MSDRLCELDVLVLDCQAGGATPAHGDLLELGWAVCGASGVRGAVRSHFIARRTARPVPRAVRELTGWSEACGADALSEQEAWAALQSEAIALAGASAATRAPSVIHYARFELAFLRDLHERFGHGEFPFEVHCLHAIAARLFPELPRRNIRALAGYLGHSTELVRRSAGHVDASAFIWRALVPLLEQRGVHSWGELGAWLAAEAAPARPARRTYPFPREQRRALPDRPGIYRFVRRNEDVLYVGKAASVRKRVASHFGASARATERALEMLTQVHAVRVTETASVLEAALLETDEIKRLDPPYNLQLRSAERRAWFAGRELRDAVPIPDDAHSIGPLPSERALFPFAALIELARGAEPRPELVARVLAVPAVFGPDAFMFAEAWRAFGHEHLSQADSSPVRRIRRASLAAWLTRRYDELEAAAEDAPHDHWDHARIERRLTRALVQGGLLLRRARWLCLLSHAEIAFREANMPRARRLTIRGAKTIESADLDSVAQLVSLASLRTSPLRERQASFDAAAYDRMRVLATELKRVQSEAGELALRVGSHLWRGAELAKLMRAV